MEAPSVSVLTAAPVKLKVSGIEREVKPIDIETLGKWEAMLRARNVACLPSQSELMASLRGHEAGAVSEAIRTLHMLHRNADMPSIDDVVDFISSPMNVVKRIAEDCIDGACDPNEIFKALLEDQGRFMAAWMAASGFGGNPTQPLDQQ